MKAFYNEIDPYCCAWLQNLMDAGHITPGKIDDRSIADLNPEDLNGYERCHFFAGIAGWELALSLSGYSGPVWTGSCPCQPFSAAGKGQASGDERHLWPVWFELIRACRPAVIFGEQVEAAIGWGWLDLVYSDLEQEGYAVGAAVLPAASVGAPHVRNRLWFTAMADANSQGLEGVYKTPRREHLQPVAGDLWRHWVSEPAMDRVAHGVPARVGKLRAAGNAIVPQVAAEFIKAAEDRG
jgi:DNA (cytosine-5)-methyltransferase 1